MRGEAIGDADATRGDAGERRARARAGARVGAETVARNRGIPTRRGVARRVSRWIRACVGSEGWWRSIDRPSGRSSEGWRTGEGNWSRPRRRIPVGVRARGRRAGDGARWLERLGRVTDEYGS